MTPGWSGRRFGAALLILVPLTISWALGIGRYGGPDEPAHVLRSYAAAHGEVLGTSAAPLPPGYRYVTVPAALASGDPSCYRHDPTVTSECAAAVDDDAPVQAATSAGLTPPLYHLVVGALARLGGDPADTTSYRLAAALLHALVLTVIVTRLVAVRPASIAALAITAAAVTPAAWFLFGVVNPNSLEVALALLAWTGVALLPRGANGPSALTSTEVWWVGVPLGLAVVVRPIAAVLALATVTVAVLSAPALRRSRALVTALVAPAALATVAQVAWALAAQVEVDDPRTAVDQSVLTSLREAISALPTTAAEAVGSLGWNEFRAPGWVMAAWTVGAAWCVASTVAGAGRVGRRGAAVWAVWVGAAVATPVLFDVVFASSVGPIWQGRYSLPIVVGVMAVARRSVDDDGRELQPRPRVLAALIVVAAVVELVTYWATVRRYSVGTDGSWLLVDAVASSAWWSPRVWVATHAFMVGAIGATGLMAVRRCSRTRR